MALWAALFGACCACNGKHAAFCWRRCRGVGHNTRAALAKRCTAAKRGEEAADGGRKGEARGRGGDGLAGPFAEPPPPGGGGEGGGGDGQPKWTIAGAPSQGTTSGEGAPVAVPVAEPAGGGSEPAWVAKE